MGEKLVPLNAIAHVIVHALGGIGRPIECVHDSVYEASLRQRGT